MIAHVLKCRAPFNGFELSPGIGSRPIQNLSHKIVFQHRFTLRKLEAIEYGQCSPAAIGR